MAGGRPCTFTSPEEFEAVSDAYFAACEAAEKRPTVNGLCLALGFRSRDTLLRYAEKPEFSDVTRKARLTLEAAWESALANPQVAGAIFWLKNQGWRDTVEQHHSGQITLASVLAGIGPGDDPPLA